MRRYERLEVYTNKMVSFKIHWRVGALRRAEVADEAETDRRVLAYIAKNHTFKTQMETIRLVESVSVR